MRKKNKKAMFILDIVFLMIFIFVFCISTLIAYKVFTEYRKVAEPVLSQNNNVTSYVLDKTQTTLNLMDTIFVFILLGLGAGCVISAYFINSHPIFFIFMIFLLIIVVILASQFSNVFYEFRSSPDMTNATSNYTVMTTLMDKFPLVMLVIGAIVLVFLLGKRANDGSYGGGL